MELTTSRNPARLLFSTDVTASAFPTEFYLRLVNPAFGNGIHDNSGNIRQFVFFGTGAAGTVIGAKIWICRRLNAISGEGFNYSRVLVAQGTGTLGTITGIASSGGVTSIIPASYRFCDSFSLSATTPGAQVLPSGALEVDMRGALFFEVEMITASGAVNGHSAAY